MPVYDQYAPVYRLTINGCDLPASVRSCVTSVRYEDGMEGGDKTFYTTGRLTSEMVIKCAQMKIPILVSRSGLTQMGYEIARQVGITMLGRATGKHYLLFTGHHRFTK